MSIDLKTNNAVFVPPAYETPHVFRQFAEVMAEVAEVIAPVWPLTDYVAVNPFAGISHRCFMDARAFMKIFSDCETLMPIEYYAADFQRGGFAVADIEEAIDELSAGGFTAAFSTDQIVDKLTTVDSPGSGLEQPVALPNRERRVKTFAEYATRATGMNWTEAIVEEISKHCAAHYDQSQSTWSSPYRHLPLFQAWRAIAEHDCNIEILGLSGFRSFVAELPHTAAATIVHLLERLKVPPAQWSTFLLCQAFSVPGWSAWAKYQTSWKDSYVEQDDLTGLLAIRLAYDAALAEAQSLSVNWTSYTDNQSASFSTSRKSPDDDSSLRYVLLRASELGYRHSLLEGLTIREEHAKCSNSRKLAQLVFCIDVRSERIRRQLESQSGDIDTFGFAGFFGMAFEYVPLSQTCGDSQLPVLLKPQFKLHEGLTDEESQSEATFSDQRSSSRSWRKSWKSFQASAVGCFTFVETTGLMYGLNLLSRAIGFAPKLPSAKVDGLKRQDACKLGPTLRGLSQQGITTSRQVDMAEGMLRNLGLTKDFAQLVVLCGHASQTENNPLAAGLDCGACGGHSGEPNARFAALLLNQPYVRQGLAERGIEIPADTHFLAGLHNTTTDTIEFFDVVGVPADLQAAYEELKLTCAAATKQTQLERLPIVASQSLSDLLKRASDWSEVRPEWGLAGNAAFIVAPRSVTKQAKLDARSFLHSYDHTQDEGGKVLETIMTAPMIVANWINMQYYASTVDNQHFGSGNKTVHNVVGGFGILSGNGGDLQTGLPWQSLHSGQEYQHLPMRLQVVIAAPLHMIERVIAKHEMVANLLNGAWLHLVAIEAGVIYRYVADGSWEKIDANQAASRKGA